MRAESLHTGPLYLAVPFMEDAAFPISFLILPRISGPPPPKRVMTLPLTTSFSVTSIIAPFIFYFVSVCLSLRGWARFG